MTNFLTTKRTFAGVVFTGLLAMAARNVTDPDVWWHLKTGQYIAVHKAVPHADPFSFTRFGQPWVAHEWLTELLFYGVFRASGWGGLIVFSASILFAAFFLLYLRCGGRPYVSGLLTLAGAWATAPLWGVRPQMISLLLTSLWLLLLERSERDSKLLLWTLPLTLLWVNLHAGFALGLVLLALFLAGELIERMLGYSSVDHSPGRLPALGLTLFADLLLVPLNPNGARMYAYPIATLRSKAMQNYIVEWASPNFHHPEYWPFLLLLLVALAGFGFSFRKIRPRDLLLLIAGAYAALVSIRMIPLFVLISVPLFSRMFAPSRQPSAQPRPHPPFRPTINAAIILAMAAFAAIHIGHVIRLQPQAEARQFPSAAVAYLQSHPLAGPLFNHYDWGGFLIWNLYPPTRVFIDGRADLYGEAFLQQFADTYQLKGAWRQTLMDWQIEAVLIPSDSPLATGLRLTPGWKVSYEDSRAVIFTLTQALASPRVAPDPQEPLEHMARPARRLRDMCKKYAMGTFCRV